MPEPTVQNRREAKKLMRSPEVEEFVQERMPVLLGRLWDLAMGVMVLEEKLDEQSGEVIPRIYRMPPDKGALTFLIENGIGKVPNRVEMTGKGGGPFRVIPWMPVEAALLELAAGDASDASDAGDAGDAGEEVADGEGD